MTTHFLRTFAFALPLAVAGMMTIQSSPAMAEGDTPQTNAAQQDCVQMRNGFAWNMCGDMFDRSVAGQAAAGAGAGPAPALPGPVEEPEEDVQRFGLSGDEIAGGGDGGR